MNDIEQIRKDFEQWYQSDRYMKVDFKKAYGNDYHYDDEHIEECWYTWQNAHYKYSITLPISEYEQTLKDAERYRLARTLGIAVVNDKGNITGAHFNEGADQRVDKAIQAAKQ
jgi:hypothetical protein